jgi:hypothetical protein
MRNILKVALASCAVSAAMATPVKAQTVELTGLGSSAYFLEAGLGANYASGAINAPCVWSENTSTVTATDTSVSPSAVDTGNAWVAWTKGTGTCAAPGSTALVYAFLSTDSVVGNRCLFNANLTTPTCSISYPTSVPAPAGLILTAGVTDCGTTGECALPLSIANALNSAKVNFAGSDIRPEDAEFAITRALATSTVTCGQALVSGSQYLNLGYANGNKIGSFNYNPSAGTGSYFNVVKFALPATTFVTLVGATPIVVAANGTGISAGSISAQTLAYLLDGTYSYTGQVAASPSATGSPLTVYLREPLSGTYNTMEYNVPNSTVAQTSQDVGKTQPTAQINCNGTVPKGLVSGSSPAAYDMNIATTSGGARQRQIGTGAELKAVLTATSNALGYGFWSAANFAGFTSTAAPNAKYLEIIPFGGTTAVDPLLNTSTAYSGTIPTSTALANVDLHTTANGTYPIWSLLRLVTVNTTAEGFANELATSTDDFVNFGTGATRPDFITPSKMTVVRSHFTPPAGTGYPATNANGDNALGTTKTACTTAEAGGDVGGVILLRTGSATLNGFESDNSYCSSTATTDGQTGHRF